MHNEQRYVLRAAGQEYRVQYVAAESNTRVFGGNSNWRGPVWFPLNYLLIEALERYDHFYGDTLRVECPTGSGHLMSLREVAHEIAGRLSRLFLRDGNGQRTQRQTSFHRPHFSSPYNFTMPYKLSCKCNDNGCGIA